MLDKKIEIKIVSESKTFQEKRKIEIIWVLLMKEEKPSGLMNKAIISSPRLVVPLPPPQLPLIFTTVTEKFGMTGPCFPRVRILRRRRGVGVAGLGGAGCCPGAIPLCLAP